MNAILLVDNNDSFSHNVVHLLREVTDRPVVICPSENLTLDEVANFDHIIFSPGPGSPDDFPVMREILRTFDTTKSILGICLGHQAICQHYGAQLKNLSTVFHGVACVIDCDPNSLLFSGVDRMTVGRYHSWVAQNIPSTLKITATHDAGTIMAVEHTSKRVYSVQFHPESYITKGGDVVLRNFVNGIS